MANTVASKETAAENPKLTGLRSSRSLQPKQKHVKSTPWNKTVTRCEIPSLLNSLFLREDPCKILQLFLNTNSLNLEVFDIHRRSFSVVFSNAP